MFDTSKVAAAIRGAWNEVGGAVDEKRIETMSRNVMSIVPGNEIVDIEHIQNLVEFELMRNQLFDVGKAYMLYRAKRSEMRSARRHPDPLAVSDYIHASKYARYREQDRRREVYAETVSRDEDMHLRKFGHIPGMRERIKKAFKFVYEKKLLPSMRSMQFGGKAIEVVNNRIYNCSATHIDRLDAFSQGFYLLLCGCGVGYSVQFEHVDKLPEFSRVDESKVVHHVIQDSIEGWADAILALLRSYVDGTYIEFAYHLIRAEGMVLKTSGGKAPGHVALKQALELVRDILNGSQGRRLRPVEAHRIMCHLADAVLSGGIRRSAMICLFSPEDSEMMYLKTGNWHSREPYLENANNSVVLKRDDVKHTQFMRVFQMTKQFGEPGFIFVADLNEVRNPCQPAWATVLTPEGIRTIGEIDAGSIVWSGKQWTKVLNKWSTGVKQVNAYRTRAGTFYGTENHRIVSEGVKVEVGQAESIDTSQGPMATNVTALDAETIMDGLVFGDGSVHAASNDLVYLFIGEKDRDYHESEIHDLIRRHRPGLGHLAWEIETSIVASEIPMTYLRSIPTRFRFGSLSTVRAFLRGLYTANGSIVSSRVTLKASSINVIRQTQEMLSSLGIPSYYTTNAAHEVQFENGKYECRESYDLNITTGRYAFQNLIGFIQNDKQQRLSKICDKPTSGRGAKNTYEIVETTPVSVEEVFDMTVEADEHTYWTGGLLVSNCAEIALNCKLTINYEVMKILKDRAKRNKPMPDVKMGEVYTGYAFCNLTEINAAKLKSREDFIAVGEAAALIGTLQAAYTDMPYLGWVSEVIAEREALLGVGMTGIMDSPEIALDADMQRDVASRIVEWNGEFAEMIGIRPAARTTTVKPSGTTALELGSVGSGIHAHHARRYIRSVTANKIEAVFNHFRATNPHMCVMKPNGDYVIEFPVIAPEGAIVKSDLGAIEFMNMVMSTQQNWVNVGTARPESSPGYTHNVSNTIHVKPNEWDAVAAHLWEHRALFSGVSFIPVDDTVYPFAPFQAILTEADESRWNQLLAHYKPVDYTALIENEDATDVGQEPACAGGYCEIPVR